MGFRRLNWFVWALTLVAVAEGTAPVRLSAPAFYLSWLRTQLSHERLTAAAVVGGRDGNSSSAVEFLEAPAGGSASSATIESTGKVPVADAWLVPSYRLSDLAAGSGEAADVSHLVYADRGLAWWDVPHSMRDALAIISTRAVAVPIGAGPLLLWYRGDVLGALAAEVPRTWQQLLAFAERYAASRQPGQPQHALCLPLGPDCTHLHLLSAVWASVAQTRSRRQGLAFDPWAGAPRIDTAGLRYALELLANLTRHSEPSWRQQGPGGSGCGSGASNSPFTSGACALTLATVGLARDADGPPGDLGATVRVASAPGSGVVWSPTSGKLVDCTKKACPLGEGLPTAGGVWVNYSPQLTAASLTGVIRASAPAEQQFKAYVVLTLLATGDALGTADLLGPVRGSELWPTADPGPDGAGLRGEAWRLSALAITHPNAGWDTSIPRIQILRDELAQLLSRAQACAIVSQAGQQTCGDILGQALQASQARIAVAYPPAEFLQWYQAHLHLDHATHDWGTDASTDAAADQGGTGSRVVVVAVASSLCGALLVVALLLLMQRRRLTLLGHVVSKLMPQRRSEAMAPGPSQDACLVITE
ncbi:hypothetical protein HYH03_002296 [Edaphochlamys debaryana]|uniref:Uncharacterized protein n=1 Tax=Edaphochlamys debaryana TaxID=47281 RepID=A0A835YLR2_9CHLO|nr:hypothetical protein HYH03_002296 [Edaphochlamys debaryana]|eukprot:KAG2500014.1 hypothetical protein HYH03_002296 [Edaphochlamys debaryana]